MISSFSFKIDPKEFLSLISPIAIPHTPRDGIAKIVVSDEGVFFNVCSLYDPQEPLDASLWIKSSALVDFIFSPAGSTQAYTVDIHKFYNFVLLCPEDRGLMSVAKISVLDTLILQHPDRESYEVKIMTVRLPRFPDCHYIRGSRAQISVTDAVDLGRLLLEWNERTPASTVIVTASNNCIVIPPEYSQGNAVDFYGLLEEGFSYVAKIFWSSHNVFSDAVRLRLSQVTISRLVSARARASVLLQIHIGSHHQPVAVLQLLLPSQIFLPA